MYLQLGVASFVCGKSPFWTLWIPQQSAHDSLYIKDEFWKSIGPIYLNCTSRKQTLITVKMQIHQHRTHYHLLLTCELYPDFLSALGKIHVNAGVNVHRMQWNQNMIRPTRPQVVSGQAVSVRCNGNLYKKYQQIERNLKGAHQKATDKPFNCKGEIQRAHTLQQHHCGPLQYSLPPAASHDTLFTHVCRYVT